MLVAMGTVLANKILVHRGLYCNQFFNINTNTWPVSAIRKLSNRNGILGRYVTDKDKTGREPPNDEPETGLFLAKPCVGGGC